MISEDEEKKIRKYNAIKERLTLLEPCKNEPTNEYLGNSINFAFLVGQRRKKRGAKNNK